MFGRGLGREADSCLPVLDYKTCFMLQANFVTVILLHVFSPLFGMLKQECQTYGLCASSSLRRLFIQGWRWSQGDQGLSQELGLCGPSEHGSRQQGGKWPLGLPLLLPLQPQQVATCPTCLCVLQTKGNKELV